MNDDDILNEITTFQPSAQTFSYAFASGDDNLTYMQNLYAKAVAMDKIKMGLLNANNNRLFSK